MDKTTLIQTKLQLESRIKNSAHWFYWIAGLSMINTVINLLGGGVNFIIGLGITQFIDGVGIGMASSLGNTFLYVAGVIDFIIAGIFIVIGKIAVKRKRWAFITGMILYALDGAIFLVFGDLLGIAFHVFALYSIYLGMPAMKKLSETEIQLQEIESQEDVMDNEYETDEEAFEETVIEEENKEI
ncbi:MAG: hypothetical protein K0R84_344 [Clostridia bacterium]|jgi:hypothetical protein|nr:hypothetical protein [Clostridia bacterium]